MKKNKISIVHKNLFLLMVLYTILVMFMIDNKNNIFWSNYVFLLIVFTIEMLIYEKTERKNREEIFYNAPIYSISVGYLIIEIIINIFLTFIQIFSLKYTLLIQIIIFIIYCIILVNLFAANKYIRNNINDTKIKVKNIRNLEVNVEVFANKIENKEVKNKLKKLAENIRYSDPISSEELIELDEKIKHNILNLEKLINDSKYELIEKCIEETNERIFERNKKCKLLK